MLFIKYFAIFVFLSITVDCFPTKDRVDIFNLTVVHINDIHAHFEEINANTSRCRPENQCFGGVARLNYKKNEIMNSAPNSIFLNAGDFYQGNVVTEPPDRSFMIIIWQAPCGTQSLGKFTFRNYLEIIYSNLSIN